MSQPPPQRPGQIMPNGRPRPGAAPGAPGAPGTSPLPSQPPQVDYGLPRLYDTSVRPASGLTRPRYAPHGVQQPQQAQPQSAWATQTRRIEQVQAQGTPVPVGTIVSWVLAGLLGLILLIVLAGGFIMFALNGSSSPALWAVYAFIALLSLIVIVGLIVLADRWDPQPLPLLLIAVFWGAAIAASIAYVVNTAIFYVLYAVTRSEATTTFVGSTIGAPIVEETSKGLGLVLLLLVARKFFNGPLDGLVYGALIGGGFAFVENIQYYLSVPEAGGTFTQSLFLVFVRGVIGIFGHSVYTSLTGVVMGLVVRKWGTLPGALVFLVATWPGMFLHACWNGGTSIAQDSLGLGGLILMLVVEVIFSGLWLALIGVLVFDESRLTRVRLGDYANQGWLTHQEVDMLATWKGRREGRRWARSIDAGPVMKTFIRESAALASTRQRLLADGASPKGLAEERRLLDRLTTNRQALLAHVR
ncbi:PrsW family intramembrane metalloprotease [Brachybacterium huguangmaarense]|uniref:PrsW family intramembrane metalloprotease n=1 Tax=Brachybacterium huguangmaarense TaxID=1652028 RepID=A0ABY6G0R1_9MICO|nr:PrsW family intramembrane metalloprotease [Brachybacterium huguangmaarense]UYG16697.1 PrsW family intramembrane metalloprotease [Brachybacterium huguangmaarense]